MSTKIEENTWFSTILWIFPKDKFRRVSYSTLRYLLLLLLTWGLLLSCGAQQTDPAPEPKVFTIHGGNEPLLLSPNIIEGNVPFIRNFLFEGLLSYDDNITTVLPGIAETWAFSHDNSSILFLLRQNTLWSDGSPITAIQVKESWMTLLTPGNDHYGLDLMLETIKGARRYWRGIGAADEVGIHVIDNFTLIVDFESSSSPILEIFCHPLFAVLPTHIIAEKGRDWTAPEYIVSNGPYVLKTWGNDTADENSYRMVKNPRYWNPARQTLDQIEYLFGGQWDDTLEAYENGDIQWCASVPVEQYPVLKIRNDFYSEPSGWFAMLYFNTASELFDTPEKRKTAMSALDTQSLTDILEDPSLFACPPYSPMVDDTTSNSGEDNNTLFRGQKVAITVPQGDLYRKTADGIARLWQQQLDMNSTVSILENLHYTNNRMNGYFQCTIQFVEIPDVTPFRFLEDFHSNSVYNDLSFADTEFDLLLEEGGGYSFTEGVQRFNKAFSLLKDTKGILFPLYYQVERGGLVRDLIYKGNLMGKMLFF